MFICVEHTHTFNVFACWLTVLVLILASCGVRPRTCVHLSRARFFPGQTQEVDRPVESTPHPRGIPAPGVGLLWRPCRRHTRTHTRVHTQTHTYSQGAHLLSKKKAKSESRFMAGACCCCLLVLTGTVGGFIWALQSMTYPGEVPRGALLLPPVCVRSLSSQLQSLPSDNPFCLLIML